MAPNTFQASLPTPASFDSPNKSNSNDDCPFCRIAKLYIAYDPSYPPPQEAAILAPSLAGPNPETYVVLSTPVVVAFLDIMPLSRGHLLLCPRRHAPKLTEATSTESRELGFYLHVLSTALSKATGVEDWNVVQNNGAAAAQVVPHMHFHIIPRPEIRAQGKWSEKFTMFGRGQRADLDPEDAEKLAQSVRDEVAEALKAEGHEQPLREKL